MNTQIMQWTQFLTTQGVAYTTERVGTDTLVLFSDGVPIPEAIRTAVEALPRMEP